MIRNTSDLDDLWEIIRTVAGCARVGPTARRGGWLAEIGSGWGLASYHRPVSVADSVVASDLASAGLVFIERIHAHVFLPMPERRTPASCLPEHGRFDAREDEIIGVDDPNMPAKINAGWWRMACEFGLLDEHREFLLCVDYRDPQAIDPEIAWVKVRLGEDWDLAGSGAANLRSYFAGMFTKRFVPEFTMASNDHRMVLNTTVWGNGTVSTIVIRPDRLHRSANDA